MYAFKYHITFVNMSAGGRGFICADISAYLFVIDAFNKGRLRKKPEPPTLPRTTTTVFCGLLKKKIFLKNFTICISKDPEWFKTYVFDKRKTTLVIKEQIFYSIF